MNEVLDGKKELILNTTRELLAKNGYAKTTLDDIANVLGMKKSSLYYYYESKDALIEGVLCNEEKKFFDIVGKSLKTGEKTLDKIINYEIAKFEYIKSTFKLHDLSANVLMEIKLKFMEHIKNVHNYEIKLIQKVLEEKIKNKEIVDCDTYKVASLILTFSEALRHKEFYFSSFNFNKEIDFTNAVEEMVYAVKLIFNGLKV